MKTRKARPEFTSEETGMKAICDLCGYNLDHHDVDFHCMEQPQHTPTPLKVSFDGFGLNDANDPYRRRLLTLAKRDDVAVGKAVELAVNMHDELVTRLKEAEARLRSVNSYLADLCLQTIAKAENK